MAIHHCSSQLQVANTSLRLGTYSNIWKYQRTIMAIGHGHNTECRIIISNRSYRIRIIHERTTVVIPRFTGHSGHSQRQSYSDCRHFSSSAGTTIQWHHHDHSWLVRTKRTFKAPRTLRTFKIKLRTFRYLKQCISQFFK